MNPRAAGLFVLAIAAGSTLLADATPLAEDAERTRVTIRGTGRAVAIERDAAMVRPRVIGRGVPGPLLEAVRLKSRGVADSTVIAYVRAHQSELPPVIDAEVIRQLRKAGAGRSVVTFLSTVAAVDIGVTGEGREEAASNAIPAAATDLDVGAAGIPYGYPMVGAYGGYPSPYTLRFARRGHPGSIRSPVHRTHPMFRRSVPPRLVGRKP